MLSCPGAWKIYLPIIPLKPHQVILPVSHLQILSCAFYCTTSHWMGLSSAVSLEEAGNRRAAKAEAMAAALASEVDMMRAAMGAAAERVQHAVNAKDTALATLETKVTH